MGHVTLNMPLLGVIFHQQLGLAMANLYTKFEVSTCTHDEDIKNGAKCRNWGGLGQLGVTRIKSSAMSQFDRTQTTSYSILIATMRLSCTVFKI